MTTPIRPDPFAALDDPTPPDRFAALDDAAPAPDRFASLDGPAPTPPHSLGASVVTAGKMLGHLATHPWELPVQMANDALTALTPNTLRPGVAVAPRVPVGPAPYAARSDATFVPDPSRTRLDPGAQEKAMLNSLVNAGLIAVPEVGLPAKLALGAGAGAYYAPQDRVAGALAGLTLGGALHGAGKLAAKVRAVPDVPLDATPETLPDAAPLSEGVNPAPAAPPPIANAPDAPSPETPIAAAAPDRFAALDGAPAAPEATAPSPTVAAAPADRFTALDAAPESIAPPIAAEASPPPQAPTPEGPTATAPEPTTYQGPPAPETPELLHAGVPPVGMPKLGTAIADTVQQAFLPASRGDAAAQTANIIRAANARRARDVVVGEAQRQQFGQAIGKLPLAQQLAIDNAIEGGTSLPEHAPAIAAIRDALDTERDAIRGLGTGKLDAYREHYLPHIWTDPAKAAAITAQLPDTPPLVGHPAFLHMRQIETMQQGIDLGLEPVSYNPVDLANLKLREMRRYRMQEEIQQEMQAKGLDPVQSEPVRRVLDNFLAPGLRGNPIYDSYMTVGNLLNQAQLGLSAFHAGMTTIEQIVSQNALGVGALLHGDVLTAGKLILTSPIAPVTQLFKGSRLLQEYSKPGSVGGPMTAMAQGVVQGGGRIEADFQPQHLQQLQRAVRSGNVGKTITTFLPALAETLTKPLMQVLVPRQKLGVFYDLAQREMDRLPPGASVEQVRAAMGRAWDSVDNRLGQVVYDNLFWNKTMKDLLHASVRSIGWNWGTWRELGGGVADWSREAANLVTGRTTKLTPRMEYAVALPMTVMLAGAITQYLYTGKGPTELKDYFYPRTGGVDKDGNPERIRLPTYWRDVASYFSHPVQTVAHKANPLLTGVLDMLENQDFYGDEIRSPDDPFLTQLRQSVDFGARQFVPFSITNTREQIKRDAGSAHVLRDVVGNLVGLTPAPRAVVRTPAQNLMAQILGDHAPQHQTPEALASAAARQDARRRAQRGDWSGVVSAVEHGLMAPKDLRQEARRIARGGPSLVSRFNQLSLPDAERVYTIATPKERRLFLYPLIQKRVRAGRL